jgi:asparaginyl-tRNA synthetase
LLKLKKLINYYLIIILLTVSTMPFTRKRLVISKLFDDISNYLEKDVSVCGWIETIRVQQKNGLAFITLNDGSSIKSLQLILTPGSTDGGELYKYDTIYGHGTKGVSIEVYGKIIVSPAKGQDIEMKCASLKILGKVDASEYPISKSKLKLDYLRQFPHLRPRTKTIAAVARVRNAMSIATHDFFQDHGFKYVQTPVLTGNDCEGAGETMSVSNTLGHGSGGSGLGPGPVGGEEKLFFGKPVNLTVSGQLHGETYATALGDIYTFGPTFRAEDSHTTRHLAEFWMVEPELCFIEFKDLIDLAEDYLKYCIKACLTECEEEIEFFTKHYQPDLKLSLEQMVDKPFTRMTYKEVIETINKDIMDGLAIINDPTIERKKFKKLAKGKHIFEGPIIRGSNGERVWSPSIGGVEGIQVLPPDYDLDSEHEKYMTTKLGGPLVITDFPAKIKSFYMKPNDDGETVQAMDIVVPNIGEIIGGSMREDDYTVLKEKMEKLGIDIPWYLDLRKYGSVPHGGFGLGFERLIMLVTGIYNIKDIIPYPRFPGHCDM